ncbi:hypothetical protein NT6N_39940 [Oceaniferula spumae]|uniref:Uncharacterized protein n=1 Tax=Oceaniferula spumae TaxID=2979115 RepID=A0AAT9FSQ4_9BACT
MNKHLALLTSLSLTTTFSLAAPPKPESVGLHTKSDKAELTLSYNNLRQLIEDLQTKQAEKKPAPPVKATVRSAVYQLELASEKLAKVTASFAVTTFADGWISLPLVSDRYPVQQIEPTNTVLTAEKGHLAFLTQGAGEHSIKISLLVPAQPDGSFNFQFIAATSGRLVISDLTGYEIQGAERGDAGDYILPIAGGDVRISPTRHAAAKASTWSADSRVLYVVKDNELQAEARVQLNAKEGDAATAANLILPKDARVISVTGPDLSRWTENLQQQIQLTWNSHGISRRRLTLLYTLPLPDADETWTLNIPHLKDAEQSRGQLALVTPAEFQLTPTREIARIEPSMAADWMKSQGMPLILKLPQASEVQLKGKRLAQIQTATATIESALFKTQIVPDGSTLTEGALTISHRDPKLWTFTLPENSEILTCQIDGNSTNPIVLSDGSLQLSLPAKQADKKPNSVVKLSFTSKLEKIQPLSGKLSIALPLTPVFIHEMHWMINLPNAYEASALDGNLTLSSNKQGGQAITLVKRLCRNQAAHVDIFYRKKNQ